jgi:hypothetical protein
MTPLTAATAPSWLAAEMPAGYRNRLEEIQRLSRDLEEMMRFGVLLCGAGVELRATVADAFAAIGYEVAAGPAAESWPMRIQLDPRRRLLVHVSTSESAITRRGADLALLFKLLHETADDADRVVLVANIEPGTRPPDRRDAIEPDAVTFLARLGANFLPAPELFGLWSLSLRDRVRARALVDTLHAQDGGVFRVPVAAAV